LYSVIQFSISRRALARFGHTAVPISAFIVAKNDSAAAAVQARAGSAGALAGIEAF